jgi:c-di-GMP-binding flagellar brake protein YcgR
VAGELVIERPEVQRRAYVRVEISRAMWLEVPVDGSDESVVCKGVLVDLSERAARCSIWVDESTPPQLVQGCAVTVHFSLRESDFALSARTRRCVTRSDREMTQLIVEFDQVGEAAKVLRRELFAEQIRQRQMSKLA